jgi:hypothetical protein
MLRKPFVKGSVHLYQNEQTEWVLEWQTPESEAHRSAFGMTEDC